MDVNTQVILCLAAPAAVGVALCFLLGRRQKTTDGPVHDLLDQLEQSLRVNGMVTEMKHRSPNMDGSLLARKRQEDMSIGFFLGRQAKIRDRPDRSLLGKTDHRLTFCWWHHLSISLNPATDDMFFPLAIRRRHRNTLAAWNYIKPWRWGISPRRTGDGLFDGFFEVLADSSRLLENFPDEATRKRLLSMEQDPYFDNLIILVSPYDVRYLVVIDPPLPSERNAIIDVVMSLARQMKDASLRASAKEPDWNEAPVYLWPARPRPVTSARPRPVNSTRQRPVASVPPRIPTWPGPGYPVPGPTG
jgi:hypothetical protein